MRSSSLHRRTRWAFTEREIGGDDDGGALVKPAGEMEQQLAAGLGERQVAEFVEDEEVHAGQMIGDPVDAGEYYFRVAPFFETASPKYDWLNRIGAVGGPARTDRCELYRS